MMPPFTLSVPVDTALRSLASAVAGKYTELSGGSAAEGQALSSSIAEAIAGMSDGAGEAASVELAFQPDPAGVAVTLQCAGRSVVVRQSIVARQG